MQRQGLALLDPSFQKAQAENTFFRITATCLRCDAYTETTSIIRQGWTAYHSVSHAAPVDNEPVAWGDFLFIVAACVELCERQLQQASVMLHYWPTSVALCAQGLALVQRPTCQVMTSSDKPCCPPGLPPPHWYALPAWPHSMSFLHLQLTSNTGLCTCQYTAVLSDSECSSTWQVLTRARKSHKH